MDYDAQVAGIRHMTWDGMEAMSFNQLRLGVELLQNRIIDLEEQINNLLIEIDAFENEPSDPEIDSLEAEIDLWFELAADLYGVIQMLEEQLASKGIGIRPAAQAVIARFHEAMNDLADMGDDDGTEQD